MTAEGSISTTACDHCGAACPSAVLACPRCSALVHAARLKALSSMATRLATSGDPVGARERWREALALVPPESRQHAEIERRIGKLDLDASSAPGGRRCARCDTSFSSSMLACPACSALVHADELKRRTRAASEAAAAGELAEALSSLRGALELLPPATKQHAQVLTRIRALSERVDAATPIAPAAARPESTPKKRRLLGPAGVLATMGLGAWKLKSIAAFALAVAKPLLLGLTKLSTLLSMAVAVGVYWVAFGWWFALGLVVSMYVHEIGHVVALRRFGIAASAPMFIPGFGAYVRLRQYPADAREDARVGLAGPLYGLGAAFVAAALGALAHAPALLAIARTGAWLNLFNLLPIGGLDGGRGFRAMSPLERWLATGASLVAWFVTGESMLVLLTIAGALRSAIGPRAAAPGASTPPPDRRAVLEYVLLVAGLSGLCMLAVPGAR